jgi:nitroimidazol reductase NimA-like FMN-containing flavoprotein (pyridoxamine 5'-phosphate oxidase superfamily)
MKKKERELTDKNTIIEILKNGKFATISMCRVNEPYIVTLSYGFDLKRNSLYFHSAKEGLKVEILRENSNVCGTVVEDLGYVMNDCSHKYRSIVFWGKMATVEDLEEKKYGFNIILNHLEDNPGKVKKRFLKNEQAYDNIYIIRLKIIEMTGKASL